MTPDHDPYDPHLHSLPKPEFRWYEGLPWVLVFAAGCIAAGALFAAGMRGFEWAAQAF